MSCPPSNTESRYAVRYSPPYRATSRGTPECSLGRIEPLLRLLRGVVAHVVLAVIRLTRQGPLQLAAVAPGPASPRLLPLAHPLVPRSPERIRAAAFQTVSTKRGRQNSSNPTELLARSQTVSRQIAKCPRDFREPSTRRCAHHPSTTPGAVHPPNNIVAQSRESVAESLTLHTLLEGRKTLLPHGVCLPCAVPCQERPAGSPPGGRPVAG